MSSARCAAGSHCLVCQAARLVTGDYVIARGLTVEASRLYARLHYDAVAREAKSE